MISQKTKHDITKIVKDYRNMYPDEYAQVIKQISQERMKNDSMGTVGKVGVLEQKLYELPETLFAMLKLKLKDAEWKEYQNSGLGGPQWFAKTFKEFAIATKI